MDIFIIAAGLVLIAIVAAGMAYFWQVSDQLQDEKLLNEFLRSENNELRKELRAAKRNDYRDSKGRFKKAPKCKK